MIWSSLHNQKEGEVTYVIENATWS